MLSKMVGLSLVYLLLSSISQAAHASENYTYKFNTKTKLGIVNFRVHGKDYNKSLAIKLENFAKNKIPQIVEYFGFIPPEAIDIVIENEEPESNGSATSFPSSLVRLYTVPPVGSGYLTTSTNYYQKLFLHEFVHILHLTKTEGVVDMAESVFGSIARLAPGIVPRWFSEGIAMWAEDYFTEEGRLKNPLMIQEVENFLIDEDKCQSIDCLDNPGIHPYGSLSYWAGGYFLKYLEDKRANSISCLVKENSNNIPFFLRREFLYCTKMDIDDSFREFISHIKQKRKGERPFTYDYQHGQHFDGDHLFYFKEIKKKDYLVKRNLISHQETLFDLKSSTRFIQDSSVNLRISSVSDYSENRKFEVLGIDNHGDKYIASTGFQYSFDLGEKELGLKFKKDRWYIYYDGKKIAMLPRYATLIRPYIANNKLHFLSYSQRYKLVSFDLKKRKISSKLLDTNYQYVGICDGEGAFYRSHGNQYINFNNGKLTYLNSKGNKEYLFLAQKNRKRVSLTNKLSYQSGRCGDLFVEAVKKKAESVKVKKLSSQSVKTSKYEGHKYLMPKYWFLFFSGTEGSLAYTRIFTSINDPMDKHRFDLSVDHYSEISSTGGALSYSYDGKYFDTNFSYFKEYTENSVNSDTELFSETLQLSIDKKFEVQNFEIKVAATGAYVNSRDVFSLEKSTEYGTYFSIYKYPKYRYQFLNTFYLFGQITKNNPENSNTYNRYGTGLGFGLDMYKNSLLSYSGNWTKLDKESFVDGLIYGGGTYRSNHRFYGIEYNDIFGNEILSSRVKFETPLLDIFKGYGLIPVFLKQITGIVGGDYISSDFIYFKNQLYRNTYAKSLFYGAGFDINIFYLLPVKFDLIFSNVELKNGQTQSSTEFAASTGITF